MSTTTGSGLGPAATPAPNGQFFMSVQEWQTVQCYVEGGIKLPITADEAVIKLGLDKSDVAHFSDLWPVYGRVHDHCVDFKTRVFPTTVSLASDIVDYGHHKAPIFYGALTRVIDQVNAGTISDQKGQIQIQAILKNLAQDAQQRAKKAQDAKNDINSFIVQTVEDKGFLTPIQDRYKQEYEGEQGKIKQFESEIQGDLDLIDHYNDEYRKDVTIACTTATYAWVVPAGTIAAAVVAGIYGAKAQEALDNVHKYQRMLEQTRGDLRAAIMLKQDLKLADDSISGIVDQLTKALPVLEKAKGIWSALADDIANVIKTIDQDIAQMPTIIAGLGVDEAIAQWKSIGDEADAYRVNAFIVTKDESDIKANAAEYALPKAA